MSKIKKKIVRYAINAQPMPPQSFEWVLFTYVQGLLSAYELVEDNEDPQLLITVNLYRSEDVFRKYTLRGVTTLSFSGESMLFKTSLLVSLVIRLQPFFLRIICGGYCTSCLGGPLCPCGTCAPYLDHTM